MLNYTFLSVLCTFFFIISTVVTFSRRGCPSSHFKCMCDVIIWITWYIHTYTFCLTVLYCYQLHQIQACDTFLYLYIENNAKLPSLRYNGALSKMQKQQHANMLKKAMLTCWCLLGNSNVYHVHHPQLPPSNPASMAKKRCFDHLQQPDLLQDALLPAL